VAQVRLDTAQREDDTTTRGEIKLNCCDDYGNCRQGRDCPIRKSRVKREIRGLAAVVGVFAMLFVCGLWWLAGAV
jgi:hypothetical protein